MTLLTKLVVVLILLTPMDLKGTEEAEKALLLSLEGYRSEPYRDTKGILTSGVGQTGIYRDMTFHQAYKAHKYRAMARFPQWESFRSDLRAHLIAAEYRGSLGGSPNTVRLINEGKWQDAAREFLRNDEYLDPATPAGIKKRMAYLAGLLRDTV